MSTSVANDNTPLASSSPRFAGPASSTPEQMRMLNARRRAPSAERSASVSPPAPAPGVVGLGIEGMEFPAHLRDDPQLDTYDSRSLLDRASLNNADVTANPLLTPTQRQTLPLDQRGLAVTLGSSPPTPPVEMTSPNPSDSDHTVIGEKDGDEPASPERVAPGAPRQTAAEFAPPQRVDFSAAHLGWGLKNEPQRVRRLIEHDQGEIEGVLRQHFDWTPSLRNLEIEYVSRAQVRSWLHTDCGLSPTHSWLMSFALPMHYSPSLTSQAPSSLGDVARPGRLLIVAPNAWWLSDSQMHYQLCQMLVLAAAHFSAPATFDRLQLYQTQPRIAAYLRDGLGGLLWGLSEVIATHFNPDAQSAHDSFRPWSWWHSRTLWQRVFQWLLSYFIPSELAPRRVGREIYTQLVDDVQNSPQVVARALAMPGATVAIRAPAGEGAVARLKPDEARGQYDNDLFRQDLKFWERYNPHSGAIGYSFSNGRRFDL